MTPTQTSNLETLSGQELADVKVQPLVLRQVLLGLQSNQRQSTAHTKRRGEVSGGGKKPWRQKGTGRARTGSIRNPLWRGGGITFGPRNEANFTKILPTRLKRQALLMALKLKADGGKLMTVSFDKPVTTVKDVKTHAGELLTLRGAIVVAADATTARSMRNLVNITPVALNRLNAYNIAQAHHVIFINDTYSQLVTKLLHV